MKLKTLVLALTGAALLAAGAQARETAPIVTPYDATYAVDPETPRGDCARAR